MNNPGRPRGFHLLDLSAIVVGYGMASLLIRAFWPAGRAGRPWPRWPPSAWSTSGSAWP